MMDTDSKSEVVNIITSQIKITALLKKITDPDLVNEFTENQARFTKQMDQDSEDSDDSNQG
tara:strand:- start:1 stop:183 length:183 start_codon:yes stop_codon:yes gene_type:complete